MQLNINLRIEVRDKAEAEALVRRLEAVPGVQNINASVGEKIESTK